MENKVCKFCQLIKTISIVQNSTDLSGGKSSYLLYEDDLIVIFKDRKPKAQVHLQTVPKLHIKNIDCLSADYIPLLEHMKEKSTQILLSNFGKEYKKVNEIQ